jgi:hypothetical protein
MLKLLKNQIISSSHNSQLIRVDVLPLDLVSQELVMIQLIKLMSAELHLT